MSGYGQISKWGSRSGGAVVKCELAFLRTDQRVNCGTKLADRQCRPAGKLRTAKMRTAQLNA